MFSLLEQLRIEKIEAFGAAFVLVTFDYDVTPIWRLDPAFQIWNGATWFDSLTVNGHPNPKQIAYTTPEFVNVGQPWRVLTRPNSFQIPPHEFPLPQSGLTTSP